MERRTLDHAKELLRILERERLMPDPFEGARVCPHCGEVVVSTREEIAHMQAEHPDVIAARLRAQRQRMVR